MCILLYDELGLKEKRKRDKNGKWVRTAEEDALVSLVGEAKEQYDNRVQKAVKERWLKALVICKLTMKIRGVRKVLSSYVNVEISEDGRASSLQLYIYTFFLFSGIDHHLLVQDFVSSSPLTSSL